MFNLGYISGRTIILFDGVIWRHIFYEIYELLDLAVVH